MYELKALSTQYIDVAPIMIITTLAIPNIRNMCRLNGIFALVELNSLFHAPIVGTRK